MDNDLPPRYYQKPNSLPRFLLSLVTIFIMLGAIPIGVYLVGQRTNFLPQAAAPQEIKEVGQTNFSLKQVNNQSPDPAELSLDVLARSDLTEANLFATRVNFPAQNLEVISVATSSADLKDQNLIADQWVEASFNNQKGEVNLVAGKAAPGIKTDPNKEYILARINFRVKSGGNVTLHFDSDSTIFSNRENKPLEVLKNDLNINLPAVPPTPSPVPTPRTRAVQVKKPALSLNLISPQGGETIPYNLNSNILWSSQGLDQISIYLLVNDQRLGRIASSEAKLGRVAFKPAEVLLPTFLSPGSSFKIEIEGINKLGERVNDSSKGPFAIVNKDLTIEASQAANLAKRGGDANRDGVINLTDLSIILSSFGKKDNLDLGIDLNGDGVVNEVDLWLFKGVLLR